jgi:hypothetical protein
VRDSFLFQEPPSLREAKLLVNLFVVENLVNNIVVATPPYEPSDVLIVSYSSLLRYFHH